MMALSAEAKAGYTDTLAQLKAALAGQPGPRDRAAKAASAGPVCGCGQWVPVTRQRRPRIVAGTVMCDVCAEQSTRAVSCFLASWTPDERSGWRWCTAPKSSLDR